MNISEIINQVSTSGYAIEESFYSHEETNQMISIIEATHHSNPNFRISADLFAIRQFLQEVPAMQQYIFTTALKKFIAEVFGENYFLVKSIFFDKPVGSNWFVSIHQDHTIAVKDKHDAPGYHLWTKKEDCYSVQPPPNVLENIFTIRIHLDDTDEGNGALNVIPGSHLHKIIRLENAEWNSAATHNCNVKKVA